VAAGLALHHDICHSHYYDPARRYLSAFDMPSVFALEMLLGSASSSLDMEGQSERKKWITNVVCVCAVYLQITGTFRPIADEFVLSISVVS
jgi:hypothetical protein